MSKLMRAVFINWATKTLFASEASRSLLVCFFSTLAKITSIDLIVWKKKNTARIQQKFWLNMQKHSSHNSWKPTSNHFLSRVQLVYVFSQCSNDMTAGTYLVDNNYASNWYHSKQEQSLLIIKIGLTEFRFCRCFISTAKIASSTVTFQVWLVYSSSLWVPEMGVLVKKIKSSLWKCSLEDTCSTI